VIRQEPPSERRAAGSDPDPHTAIDGVPGGRGGDWVPADPLPHPFFAPGRCHPLLKHPPIAFNGFMFMIGRARWDRPHPSASVLQGRRRGGPARPSGARYEWGSGHRSACNGLFCALGSKDAVRHPWEPVGSCAISRWPSLSRPRSIDIIELFRLHYTLAPHAMR
jgi:hypothetical protein